MVSIEQFTKPLGRNLHKIRLQVRNAPPLVEPIFLTGTVRSSTTLLADCLGQHPAVSHIGFELSPDWSLLAGMKIAGPGTTDERCPPLTEADLTEPRRARIRKRFASLMLHRGGRAGTRFLNKNPHFWNKLRFLRAVFPDASFIVTSRDLCSTVASTKLLWIKMAKEAGRQHYLPREPEQCWSCPPPSAALKDADAARLFPGGDVATIAEYWLRTYEVIEESTRDFSRLHFVRHSEFVAEPKAVLKGLHQALGLPPADYALPEKLDGTRNNRWREILSEEEQASLFRFIKEQSARIERLTSVDTSLPL